jgi:hypothetical protein
VWPFLDRLNRLRNSLAHSIDVPNLEVEVEYLTSLIAPTVDTLIEPSHRRVYLFTLALGYVAGALGAAGSQEPECLSHRGNLTTR